MQDPHLNNLRVALYGRISTEEQREGQNIDSQLEELERFAKEKHWTVVARYKDEGWSGSLLACPELDKMRDDASKQMFDAILINDVDRLARDVTHLGILKRDLERTGVRVLFRKIPSDNNPTQNLLVNILGSFAEFECELIADRTSRGKRYKVEVRNEFVGTIPPYGFRYIPKNRYGNDGGKLELHPEEAAVVRDVFRWVDEEGLSARKVMSRLNELGVSPRKRGSSWQKTSVLSMLHCEASVPR